MKNCGRIKGCFVILCVAVVSLVLAMPALGQEKKKDEDVLKGTLEAAPAPAGGKLAPFVVKTDKESYPVVRNAVVKKMEKHVGKKAKFTGKIKEMDGRKVMEVWVYERMEESTAKK
ncbi:MAG: hypothetical protein PHS17_09325 [Desulfobacterales bacterium]|nr:hypothetical protein [Desulfobacterales bacterium]